MSAERSCTSLAFRLADLDFPPIPLQGKAVRGAALAGWRRRLEPDLGRIAARHSATKAAAHHVQARWPTGERAAAAALASRELHARGTSWVELIDRGLKPAPAPPPKPQPPPAQRRAPSTAAVLAKLDWLIRWAWWHIEDPREQVRLMALHDRSGPYSADEIRHINSATQRMEAVCGARCGEEVPL